MEINKAWKEEWEYSTRFMPEIIDRILAIFDWADPKIEIADFEEDVKHNTDLVLCLHKYGNIKLTIAVRVRAPEFFCFVDEVTIRNILAFNGKLHKNKDGYIIDDTEYQKLRKGYGDLECYCIAAPDNVHLRSFYLTGLHNVRDLIEREAKQYQYETEFRTMIGDTGKINATWNSKRQHMANNTGCGFLTYKKREIPGEPFADYVIKNYKGGVA